MRQPHKQYTTLSATLAVLHMPAEIQAFLRHTLIYVVRVTVPAKYALGCLSSPCTSHAQTTLPIPGYPEPATNQQHHVHVRDSMLTADKHTSSTSKAGPVASVYSLQKVSVGGHLGNFLAVIAFSHGKLSLLKSPAGRRASESRCIALCSKLTTCAALEAPSWPSWVKAAASWMSFTN